MIGCVSEVREAAYAATLEKSRIYSNGQTTSFIYVSKLVIKGRGEGHQMSSLSGKELKGRKGQEKVAQIWMFGGRIEFCGNELC